MELLLMALTVCVGTGVLVYEAVREAQAKRRNLPQADERKDVRVVTWVDDFGPYAVTVLSWPEFRNLVTKDGRVSFAGNSNTHDRRTAIAKGLDTWREKGSLWHEADGRTYRCDFPTSGSLSTLSSFTTAPGIKA